MPDFDFFDRLLRESLFPTVARNYATWLDPDDPASWPEVREHVALCGISPESAVGLIVNGYAKDVLKKLPMEFAVEAQKLLSISLEGSVG
jgi:hypothetical protein